MGDTWIAIAALATDVMILAWLVFTWIYEGHHKRCKIEIACPRCKRLHEVGCAADRRMERCKRPPSGWICTREFAHDGPCAAIIDDSYHDYDRMVDDGPHMEMPP